MAEIKPLSDEHCNEVVHLHLCNLRSCFAGISGQRCLHAYYATIAEGKGACGYVAEAEGIVVGYVCGVWDPSLVRSVLLKRRWHVLIAWGSAQLAIRPALIISFIHRLKDPLHEPETVTENGYELRPIVVTPAARGTGIAAELVTTLLTDARRRGFQRVHLFAEVDNEVASRFYRKVGFVQTDSLHWFGQTYIRYECSVYEHRNLC